MQLFAKINGAKKEKEDLVDEKGVGSSVDSEYLLTRVLTREYLFFDTFWHSSLLEFNLSLLTILERVEY